MNYKKRKRAVISHKWREGEQRGREERERERERERDK